VEFLEKHPSCQPKPLPPNFWPFPVGGFSAAEFAEDDAHIILCELGLEPSEAASLAFSLVAFVSSHELHEFVIAALGDSPAPDVGWAEVIDGLHELGISWIKELKVCTH
jgi:hypothetical protein